MNPPFTFGRFVIGAQEIDSATLRKLPPKESPAFAQVAKARAHLESARQALRSVARLTGNTVSRG